MYDHLWYSISTYATHQHSVLCTEPASIRTPAPTTLCIHATHTTHTHRTIISHHQKVSYMCISLSPTSWELEGRRLVRQVMVEIIICTSLMAHSLLHPVRTPVTTLWGVCVCACVRARVHKCSYIMRLYYMYVQLRQCRFEVFFIL